VHDCRSDRRTISALELTGKRTEVLDRVRARRRALIAAATTKWTQRDCEQFAVLLHRFTEDLETPYPHDPPATTDS